MTVARLATLLAALTVVACKGPAQEATSAPALPGAAASDAIDLFAVDRTVTPGDDFYAFANRTWETTHEIPADRSTWGPRTALIENTLRRTRDILERPAAGTPTPGSVEQQVGDYYASFMDEGAIEGAGAAPLQPTLEHIAAIDSRGALARVLGEEVRADVDALNNTNFHTDRLFGVWITGDINDPSRHVPYLLQGGLDMPDREYYLADSERMRSLRARFQQHVATMLALAHVPDADEAAAAVVALETRMAGVHATRAQSANVPRSNNPWPRTELSTRAPGLDWAAFLAAARIDREPVIIAWQPDATRGLAALVASEPLTAWKHWLTFHAIDRYAAVLPKPFAAEQFAFHGTALTGTPQIAERWKRGVASANAALPAPVGQLFVRRYFPAETKAQVEAMVRNLIVAFGTRIDRLSWMSPATKARARQKLATLRVGVGYPDRWPDYRLLRIVRGDALGNLQRAESFAYERSLAKLGAAVDKNEWWISPQTVNALNVPPQNAMNFPAAILAPPMFDPAAPSAANYGAIGSVIGHEISHSFDDTGALFDAEGRMANWWTLDDRRHFDAAAEALVAQYDAYQPFPDLHVNGRLTLSENIADVAGLAVAFDAWRGTPEGRGTTQKQPLTGPQLFFVSYGHVRLLKSREPALRQQVITDGHAPAPYRTAAVRNVDAWYDAFDVKPGQAFYLDPERRVRVW